MDTIYALSSGQGRAGVAVIRISGQGARAAIDAFGNALPSSRQAALRRFALPGSKELIDRGLLLWFPGPASFTGEDMAEFHVHGGRAIVQAMLAGLGELPDFRAAEPGEFTRRAFVNGKLDLTEVEGLSDLIDADTELQRRAALRVALGENRALYEGWRAQLLQARALLEAMIDFSDEADAPVETRQDIVSLCAQLSQEIVVHEKSGQRARRIRDGVLVVIAGPPNAGKSSLLNWLARRDVAIVAPEAGTTRDILEVQLDLGGVAFTVCDTAGLREAENLVEAEGVRRAEKKLREADVVIWLDEDGDKPPVLDQPIWAYRSKSDLRETNGGGEDLSVKTGMGLEALIERLKRFGSELLADDDDSPLMVRDRHRLAFVEARRHLDAVSKRGAATPAEFLAEELRLAARAVGRVTGAVDVDDILGEIFSRFCIGK